MVIVGVKIIVLITSACEKVRMLVLMERVVNR
jgi:hypothetical protein